MSENTFVPAERVQRIRESPSTAAAGKVRELKAEGRTILDFTVGEPDVDTPDAVKAAAIRAIERGETKYTSVNGTVELRRAIRDRMARATGVDFEDANIAVGGGGKQLLYLAFTATLNPGDEVIVPAPYWVSYPDRVLANDGTPVIAATDASSDYKITPDQLRSLITDRTKWLVLNAPSNPSGAVYSAEELRELGKVLAEAPQVWVLTDEIYDEIMYGDEPFAHFVEAVPALRGRTLTVNGVSKAYAMTGWRLGYAVGPAPLIRAINLLQSQTSSCPSSISQAAAAEALSGDQSFVTETLGLYRERRDIAVEGIRAIEGLEPIVPQGAFYLFVDCRGILGRTSADGSVLETDEDVTLYLLERASVAVIQGSAYGLDGYFRMSFATDADTIRKGIRAIGNAVASLS